ESVLERTRKESGIAKKLRGRVQIVLSGPEFTECRSAAAARLLAHEQRRRNNSVKESKAAAHHDIAAGSQAVRKPDSGIEIVHRIVQNPTWPSLKVPTQTEAQVQVLGGPPFVLNKQAVVGVVERAFGLIADIGGIASRSENCRIKRRFCEIRRLKALHPENHWRMVLQVRAIAR